MRSKAALSNTYSSLILQIATIVCGFILPGIIINEYGSRINGMVSSITQFLGFITLLELGMGGVARAALYKPLAEKQNVSAIIIATERFYKAIAYIFLIFVVLIAVLYPFIISNQFDRMFTFTLVLIIGISSFIQYYFGITYQLLLQADQKRFVTSYLQVATLILSTIVSVILIKLGAGIHLVKLGSALIFIFKPIFLNIYVKKKYNIQKNTNPDNEALKQRWDGLGHHLAFFLHRQTDVIVITIFLNIKEVSVYSIYLMVVTGMEKIVTVLSSGVEAAFGNMLAKGEGGILKKNFQIYELLSFTLTTVLFTSTSLLVIPFIKIYTMGINDVNYIRPLFAYILTITVAVYCIRLPYHYVVLAAGHFKQTRNGAFFEASINIIMSVILINFFGLVGVTIGTLCAMLFRTIQYAIYLSRHIINRSMWGFFSRIIASICAACLIIFIVYLMPTMNVDTYTMWVVYAIIIVLISTTVTLLMNFIFYFGDMRNTYRVIRRMLQK